MSVWALVVVTLCGRGGGAGKERASGIEVVVDPNVFVHKRRVKTAAEIEGICRAQRQPTRRWRSASS